MIHDSQKSHGNTNILDHEKKNFNGKFSTKFVLAKRNILVRQSVIMQCAE